MFEILSVDSLVVILDDLLHNSKSEPWMVNCITMLLLDKLDNNHDLVKQRLQESGLHLVYSISASQLNCSLV